ncbi:MAG: glucosamine-6-phosphate deaminase [Thermobacillus sp. ZCTH02-B1]|uniref:glucosamine-6-phosphate deaminase n=1 Tax=Thermobacillus sp. ZCTH02-B1 TaxID=1858795 RepID=UPI000B57B289|nr:glucosamine-6-phosphate deaminase [Thermobacillus sp. ZCTH02-B1]OUM96614.1 MAG: glucosamine-6-phosphate deaminase [Thermobacillus sp. ZCTH02-B1]
MKLNIFANQEQLHEAAAQTIIELLRQKPDAVLGLATGGTPVGIYEALAAAVRRGEVSFARATTFNLDEYVGLPPGHPETYRFYMEQHLFRHIDIPPEQTHIPDGNAPELERECERYERLLETAGRIDLMLLGLGHNGHIGFNEPGRVLHSRTHVAVLHPQTRKANARFFRTPEEVPTRAITMGLGSILKARTILLVVKGADKADIVHRALTGPLTTECPASLLQLHPHLVVMLDEEAATKIKRAASG